MPKMKPISRDEIRTAVRDAVKSQIYSQAALITTDKIRKELMAITAGQRSLVIQGLLGVDHHYGEVKLYQTNGHVTELQQWVKNALGDELRTFVETCARDAWEAEKSSIKANVKTAVCKHVHEQCHGYNFRSVIGETVKTHIIEATKGVLEEVILEIAPMIEPEHREIT